MRGFEIRVQSQPLEEHDGRKPSAGRGLQEWQRAHVAEQAAVPASMVRLTCGEQPRRLTPDHEAKEE